MFGAEYETQEFVCREFLFKNIILRARIAADMHYHIFFCIVLFFA